MVDMLIYVHVLMMAVQILTSVLSSMVVAIKHVSIQLETSPVNVMMAMCLSMKEIVLV